MNCKDNYLKQFMNCSRKDFNSSVITSMEIMVRASFECEANFDVANSHLLWIIYCQNFSVTSTFAGELWIGLLSGPSGIVCVVFVQHAESEIENNNLSAILFTSVTGTWEYPISNMWQKKDGPLITHPLSWTG